MSRKLNSSTPHNASSSHDYWIATGIAIVVMGTLGVWLSPFVDWSSEELRHMPPLRGQWEVLKSVLPWAVGGVTWVVTVLIRQRRLRELNVQRLKSL
jgi:hypothetical protein